MAFNFGHHFKIGRMERHVLILKQRDERFLLARFSAMGELVVSRFGNSRHVVQARDEHFGQNLGDGYRIEKILFGQFCFIEIAPKPAGAFEAAGSRRLPNFRRTEVRVVGIRISHALHDGDLPLLEHALERFHDGVKADLLINRQHFFAWNGQ